MAAAPHGRRCCCYSNRLDHTWQDPVCSSPILGSPLVESDSMQVCSIGLHVPWASASDPELAILMIKDDRQYRVLSPDYSNPSHEAIWNLAVLPAQTKFPSKAVRWYGRVVCSCVGNATSVLWSVWMGHHTAVNFVQDHVLPCIPLFMRTKGCSRRGPV